MGAPTTALRYEDLPPLLALLDGDEKHDPSAESTLDVLWVLYDRVLRIEPDSLDDPGRDRFLLSKGHGPSAYYAILAAKGFLPVEALPGFGAFPSPLGHHPDRALVPGVEISSGSLGHGLPIAVGSALALDLQPRNPARVFCLLGDGELDEGSNFEAIQLAGRLGLRRLTAVLVDNGSSTHGWPGGASARFEVEGWSTITVPGRDHDALEAALGSQSVSRPQLVVARVEGSEE